MEALEEEAVEVVDSKDVTREKAGGRRVGGAPVAAAVAVAAPCGPSIGRSMLPRLPRTAEEEAEVVEVDEG